MKILIIRFSSIGDIVLTTPVIRACKTQLSEAEVHFATKKNYAQIVKNNPYVDQVKTLDSSLSELIRSIRKEKYDVIIDLHNNIRTKIIRLLTGTPMVSFQKINWAKWLMVNLKIDQLPKRHIVDRYLDTVKKLGVANDQMGLDYFIPDKDVVEREWLPEAFHQKFVAYAIGGQHETKKLPFKKMIELCDRINAPVVLLGDKGDAETAAKIEAFFNHETDVAYADGLHQLNKKTVIFNGCGKFNLNQSASIVKQATYVFTHDTGIMHIAAAFKKEIFSIWGNTIPQFGMYPYRTRFTIFENNKIKCRPCSKIGFNKCPKGHFDCMNKLTFDFYLKKLWM